MWTSTVDRDGHDEVWTREQWQEAKEVVLDEWSTRGYYRELELPNAVDGEHANVTYGNGVVVVVLPVSSQTIPATLTLEAIGPAHGEQVGNAGHMQV